MRLILISGLSGSGKSIALRALEDSGFYCVDNLPATMLHEAMSLYADYGYKQIAISVDTRSSPHWAHCRMKYTSCASRRGCTIAVSGGQAGNPGQAFFRNPPSPSTVRDWSTVEECIQLEQELLASIQEMGIRIDTSELSANALKSGIKQLVEADSSRLTIIFESFGFKHGVPLNADFVFDVRCLPNPYYDPALRPFTGRDQPIIDFFGSNRWWQK
jgi:UPF0042 nucleotide-binding protein